MADESVTEAVDNEVNSRVETVAAVAAAQIDNANKDAEAIARAAVQSEHAARFNSFQESVSSWQTTAASKLTETENRLAAAETQVATMGLALGELLEKQKQAATLVVSQPPVTQPEPPSESGEGLSDGEKKKTEEKPQPQPEKPKRRML